MANQILDLNTLVDRPKIRIVSKTHPEGRMYDLLLPDELGVLDHQRIATRHRQVAQLRDKDLDRLTGKQARELTSALDDIVQVVIPTLEDPVLKDLSDGQKTAIVQAFEQQIPDTPGGDVGPTTPPTGGA